MIKKNTPFELVLFSIMVTLLLIGLVQQNTNSYIIIAIAYALSGIVILSKTLRVKGASILNKTICIACIATIFVAAAYTLSHQNNNWSGLWIAALCVFSLASKNAINQKAAESQQNNLSK